MIIPGAVFVGCIIILSYHAFIPDTAFFSGDGGLKYLLLKENIENGFTVSLPLTDVQWIQDLYRDGYYPFGEPFTYRINEENVVSFPIYYLLLNIPFFKWFGVKGLYIIPALSTVLLWVWFLRICKKIDNSAWLVAGAAILIVLGCPVMVYAGIFWEHALACLFSLSGLAFLVSTMRNKKKAALLGVLLGLTCWLRPEGIILSALVGAAVLYRLGRQPAGVIFNGCLCIVVIGFFIANQIIYGHFLGVHSLQVVEAVDQVNKIYQGFTHVKEMSYWLLRFFPVSILFFGVMAWMIWHGRLFSNRYFLIGLVVFLFLIITPFLVPNSGGKQWGPRYYLIIMPYATLVIYQGISSLQNRYLRMATNLLAVVVIGYSAYFNSYWGYSYLKDNYENRIAPGIEYLHRQEAVHVIVDDQLIAQEFGVLFNDKVFFQADAENIQRLLNVIGNQGYKETVFITVDKDRKINLLQEAFKIKKQDLLGNYRFFILVNE